MVRIPPPQCRKYLFHVALTEKAQHCGVRSRVVLFVFNTINIAKQEMYFPAFVLLYVCSYNKIMKKGVTWCGIWILSKAVWIILKII